MPTWPSLLPFAKRQNLRKIFGATKFSIAPWFIGTLCRKTELDRSDSPPKQCGILHPVGSCLRSEIGDVNSGEGSDSGQWGGVW